MIATIQNWLHRLIWPEAPKAERSMRAISSKALTLKASEVLHYCSAGNLGATAADLERGLPVQRALLRILFDYRSGKAQTVEERAIGELLDHVARTYLEAKP